VPQLHLTGLETMTPWLPPHGGHILVLQHSLSAPLLQPQHQGYIRQLLPLL
jgi:hypothetical protein